MEMPGGGSSPETQEKSAAHAKAQDVVALQPFLPQGPWLGRRQALVTALLTAGPAAAPC